MSNFLAIATVTAALRQLIYDGVATDIPGADVTTVRPEGASSGVPSTGVNVYLYQVTPNPAYRNADLPTRSSDGRLTQRPLMGLDLHYLLTFYGSDIRLEPQRLMGSAARTLHSTPVLSRDLIRETITDPMFDFLAASDLAESIELVKFTPAHISLEDLSKLWSVFFQTPYALSAAYQATVVLIEGEETPKTALPVRGFNLYTRVFRQPVIEQVVSDAGSGQPITSGGSIVIHGRQLGGENTKVLIDGKEISVVAAVGERRIKLALPGDLKAGVHGVQVVQPEMMGTPPSPHRGVESNVAAFVLRPTITGVTASPAAEVKVTLSPKVGSNQRVVLLLNEFEPPADRPARIYSFDEPDREAPDADGDTDSVVFHVTGVQQGDYLVRVQVDGAESPLHVSPDPQNPRYDGPKVHIP